MREPDVRVSMTGSTWKLGGLTKKQLARRVWHEIMQDDLLGRSARLAYFFLFAIFPLVIFLTSLIGIIEGPRSLQLRHLIADISRAIPSSAGVLVTETLRHALARSGNGKLAFGITIALFSASSGMAAMMDTLNAVFDVPEGRSMLRKRVTAVLLTIAVGILVLAAIFLITLGGKLAEAVSNGGLYRTWQIVQYPVAFLFLLIAFSLVYRFAPNIEEPRWRVFTPGAVAGLCLWLIASFGMRVYLHHFNTYTSDYGTMGAVMVLMLWFYLTGLAFLIGGEVDAIIERAGLGRSKGRRAERETTQGRPVPHRAA
ncbi:MAG TPA: YihY/virulence factor BrkB family protein [Terracidiphilus sp.]